MSIARPWLVLTEVRKESLLTPSAATLGRGGRLISSVREGSASFESGLAAGDWRGVGVHSIAVDEGPGGQCLGGGAETEHLHRDLPVTGWQPEFVTTVISGGGRNLLRAAFSGFGTLENWPGFARKK